MQKFAVRTGKGTVDIYTQEFTDVVTYAWRVPCQYSGWESVMYKGRRYRLYGGIHTDWFICLNSPIKTRKVVQQTLPLS